MGTSPPGRWDRLWEDTLARFSSPRGRSGSTPSTETGPAEHVLLDYPRTEIRLYVTSKMERLHRIRSCKKEPWTVRWLEEHVEPGQVVYDVGANVGTFTLVAAVARGAQVVAFEPGYANFARLCENIALNTCNDRVTAVPLPLAETTGLFRFHYSGVETGQSRHRLSASGPQRKLAKRVDYAMCGMRLDDARAQFGFPAPSHIKLDVDGGELRVLQGAVETLRLPQLKTMLVEIEQALVSDVERLCADCGLSKVRAVSRGDAPEYAIFARA